MPDETPIAQLTAYWNAYADIFERLFERWTLQPARTLHAVSRLDRPDGSWKSVVRQTDAVLAAGKPIALETRILLGRRAAS